MKFDKLPISDVEILKFRRNELFRDFEDHPGRLSLAREIKTIDDRIAELTEIAGKKDARTPGHSSRNLSRNRGN